MTENILLLISEKSNIFPTAGRSADIFGLYAVRARRLDPSIARHTDEIADLCCLFRVARLEAFGSAARGADFDDARSDADFLVEFSADREQDPLEQFFALALALEATLGRRVDPVEIGARKSVRYRDGRTGPRDGLRIVTRVPTWRTLSGPKRRSSPSMRASMKIATRALQSRSWR
jgi:predicted nucleotidyltransferase